MCPCSGYQSSQCYTWKKTVTFISFVHAQHISILRCFQIHLDVWFHIYTLDFVLVSFGFLQIVAQGSVLENEIGSVGSGILEDCKPQIYVCCRRFL